MQFKSIKRILYPLIKAGQDWQNISLNGQKHSPRFYFSNVQWLILIISLLSLLRLKSGLSLNLIGYIMSGFSISVSLFISLLISIFDKFESTKLDKFPHSEELTIRLTQKKRFFKKFISITSYLVVNSILIILLCSLSYIFDLSSHLDLSNLTFKESEIDYVLTFFNILILIYRVSLSYFLLNYLTLTLFITSSAFEYYISEIDRQKF